MELLLLLLAAHLLADYPLQTSWIFSKKTTGFWNGAYHSGTMLVTHMLFTLPYLHDLRFTLALVALAGIHQTQDYLKIRFADRPRIFVFGGYVVDQLLHFIGAGALAYLGYVWDIVPQQTWILPWHTLTVAIFIIFLLLTTFVWDVTLHVWRNRHRAAAPLTRDWRGMAWRGACATVVFWGGYTWLIG